MKNILPQVLPHMNQIRSHPHQTQRLQNGSSCTHPLYGMLMNTFVAPPQRSSPSTLPTLNTIVSSEGQLRPFGYSTNRPTLRESTRRSPRSCRTWPDYQGTTPDNLARSRTVRALTSYRLGTKLPRQRHIRLDSPDTPLDRLAQSQTSGPLHQIVWVRVRRTRGYTTRSFYTHPSSTTRPHQCHIIILSCHLICPGPNTLRPSESTRDIGQEGMAPIGHLTHISNILGRKDDNIMSDNLRFSSPYLKYGHRM